MGWWSSDIMGGDTPLDFEGLIYELLGVEMFTEDPVNDDKIMLTKEQLEKGQQKCLYRILRHKFDVEIGLQVLGYMMINVGAKMTEETKINVLAGIDADDWKEKERIDKMKAFRTIVENYDGSAPIEITSEGLFEAISNHIQSGNEGLVNKNL